MKWKLKIKNKKTEWYKVFAWKPVRTEDNYRVWLEFVNKRYKVHMSGGSYVYQIIEKDEKI